MFFQLLLATMSITLVITAFLGIYEHLYMRTVLNSIWRLVGYITLQIWAVVLALLATDALYSEWVMLASWIPFTIAAIGHLGYRRTNSKAIAEFEERQRQLRQIKTIHDASVQIVERLEKRTGELKRQV